MVSGPPRQEPVCRTIMFSSRNIHFAILGIILGATSGYIFAFYQVEKAMPAREPQQLQGAAGAPDNHPEVDNEQMLALFNRALEQNPNDPTLLARYGNFLFDLERYEESVDMYRKVLAMEPGNLEVRTDLGSALWNLGRKDEAAAAYTETLKSDPDHMLTLHNLFVVYVEDGRNLSAAADLLARMERIEPQYSALPVLRNRLEEERRKAP